MSTFQYWVTVVILFIFPVNLFACGWVGWRAKQEGNYNKVFSIIFYSLGVCFLFVSVYVVSTGKI